MFLFATTRTRNVHCHYARSQVDSTLSAIIWEFKNLHTRYRSGGKVPPQGVFYSLIKLLREMDDGGNFTVFEVPASFPLGHLLIEIGDSTVIQAHVCNPESFYSKRYINDVSDRVRVRKSLAWPSNIVKEMTNFDEEINAVHAAEDSVGAITCLCKIRQSFADQLLHDSEWDQCVAELISKFYAGAKSAYSKRETTRVLANLTITSINHVLHFHADGLID